MGLPADHALAGTKPQVNDIVIQGYILSYDAGNEKKRIVIGLGGTSKWPWKVCR
jgi:hypothetical protein